MTGPGELPVLVVRVADAAVARVAADAAAGVAGVEALRPTLLQGIAGVARSALARPQAGPDGVEVERTDGALRLQVRLSLLPGAGLAAVEQVQRAVADAVEELLGERPAVRVLVVG